MPGNVLYNRVSANLRYNKAGSWYLPAMTRLKEHIPENFNRLSNV